MTILKDFFAEIFFNTIPWLGEDVSQLKVLHIGQNKIEDWKAVKKYLDSKDISVRPRDMEELYFALGFKDIEFCNINTMEEWFKDNNKKYDFIFNCHSSDKMFDLIRFFDIVDHVANSPCHMLHITPFISSTEMGYHTLNPSFYKMLMEMFKYDSGPKFIGSLDAYHKEQIDFAADISNDRYAKRHFLDKRFVPNQGYNYPIFLSVLLYKRSKDVQEDD